MDKANRKAIIAGNWKMNKTASEAAILVVQRESKHFNAAGVCLA